MSSKLPARPPMRWGGSLPAGADGEASGAESVMTESIRAGHQGQEYFPEDREALEEMLRVVEEDLRKWALYIKELSALEDPSNGVFYAAELHEARQYRMALRYRSDFCQARLRRLNEF